MRVVTVPVFQLLLKLLKMATLILGQEWLIRICATL